MYLSVYSYHMHIFLCHLLSFELWIKRNFFYFKELSDEQKEYQQTARKFTREVVIPAAEHHDKTGEVNNVHRAHVRGRLGQRNCLVKVDFTFSLVKSEVPVAL
jgi:hypothetical protein